MTAHYHTHGSDVKNPGAYSQFSDTDLSSYQRRHINGYLGTPQGAVRFFNYARWFQNMPRSAFDLRIRPPGYLPVFAVPYQ